MDANAPPTPARDTALRPEAPRPLAGRTVSLSDLIAAEETFKAPAAEIDWAAEGPAAWLVEHGCTADEMRSAIEMGAVAVRVVVEASPEGRRRLGEVMRQYRGLSREQRAVMASVRLGALCRMSRGALAREANRRLGRGAAPWARGAHRRAPRRGSHAARRSNRTNAPPEGDPDPSGDDDPDGAPHRVERPRRRGELLHVSHYLLPFLDRLAVVVAVTL